MKTYVLYHANCNDGAGAALAAWMKLGDEGVEYIPVQYGEAPPEMEPGSTIYIIDFSYKHEILSDLAQLNERVVVIDHHKTALEDLSVPFASEPGQRIEINFDMDHSGAVLTWKYFHGLKQVPALFSHIQDRDLWRLEYPGTQFVTRALGLYPDWREWRVFISDNDYLEKLIGEGLVIDRFLKQQAEKIIQTPPRSFAPYDDADVPIYNLQGFTISDTLHAALEKYPESPYAVGYFDLTDKRVYSLRSRNSEDVDVSAIAKRFGGGGHKHAAGFSVSFED